MRLVLTELKLSLVRGRAFIRFSASVAEYEGLRHPGMQLNGLLTSQMRLSVQCESYALIHRPYGKEVGHLFFPQLF